MCVPVPVPPRQLRLFASIVLVHCAGGGTHGWILFQTQPFSLRDICRTVASCSYSSGEQQQKYEETGVIVCGDVFWLVYLVCALIARTF